MKALALAIALLLLCCADARAEPDVIKLLREFVWPPRVRSEPLPDVDFMPAAEPSAPAVPPSWLPPPDVLAPTPPVAAWPEVQRPVERPPISEKPQLRNEQKKPQRDRQEQQRKAATEKQQQQPLAATTTATPHCTPAPQTSCADICSYARSAPIAVLRALGRAKGYCDPTPTQEAYGKACIKKNCPDAFSK